MSGINAGDLDREITLITGVKTQDAGTGEEVIVWDADATATSQTVWAQWLPGGTREAWSSQQRLGAYIDGVLRVYAVCPVPTPDGTRVVFEGRQFDLRGVIEIGRGDGLELAVVARGEGTV